MTRSTRPRTTTAHIPLAVGEPAGAATRGALIIAYARRPLRSASPLLRNLPYELRFSVHLHRAGSQHGDGPISPERQRASRSEVATGVRTRRRRWTPSTSRSGATTRSPRARSSSSTPPASPAPSPSHARRPPRPLTPSSRAGRLFAACRATEKTKDATRFRRVGIPSRNVRLGRHGTEWNRPRNRCRHLRFFRNFGAQRRS